MARFTLTRKAVSDLRDIAKYTTEQWGIEQRNLYLGMLDTAFHRIAKNPLLGKDCSDILSGYRKLPIGSHLIFYRCSSPNLIMIVRILHSRMDIEARLPEI